MNKLPGTSQCKVHGFQVTLRCIYCTQPWKEDAYLPVQTKTAKQ